VIRRLRIPQLGGRKGATLEQRHRLADLAKQAGIETPVVVWYSQAEAAIRRLEDYLRQPQLEGMEKLR
jgi:hypothetical protein